jgi:hypothetical protein
MLFQTQFTSPDNSTYGQHLLMVRMFGSKDPEVFLPRDYVWCEEDGILFVRRGRPTNDLPWEPVTVPATNSMITIKLLARPRLFDTLGQRLREQGVPEEVALEQVRARRRKGARPSIIDPQQNLEWLDFTADRIGLKIEAAQVEMVHKRIAKPNVTRKNHHYGHFTLMASYFTAVAKVLDSTSFETGLAFGVGDSKAYGCGYIHFWQRGQ